MTLSELRLQSLRHQNRGRVEDFLLFLRVGDEDLCQLREAGLVLLGRGPHQVAERLHDPPVLGEHPRQLRLERRDPRDAAPPSPGSAGLPPRASEGRGQGATSSSSRAMCGCSTFMTARAASPVLPPAFMARASCSWSSSCSIWIDWGTLVSMLTRLSCGRREVRSEDLRRRTSAHSLSVAASASPRGRVGVGDQVRAHRRLDRGAERVHAPAPREPRRPCGDRPRRRRRAVREPGGRAGSPAGSRCRRRTTGSSPGAASCAARRGSETGIRQNRQASLRVSSAAGGASPELHPRARRRIEQRAASNRAITADLPRARGRGGPAVPPRPSDPESDAARGAHQVEHPGSVGGRARRSRARPAAQTAAGRDRAQLARRVPGRAARAAAAARRAARAGPRAPAA